MPAQDWGTNAEPRSEHSSPALPLTYKPKYEMLGCAHSFPS
ncbi:hypothetical protein QFZ36_002686 [Pseudarthrobacter siccitolerans]|uniref:Uncharacterized protein n=1 Tax=Pseudarthrobacter siccitolerans TaxID=861266 RepID=A0ABU0PMF8_9MICC|nr:hypothetical protein [Pseudarthrobacter siccitolerans]MDQ0733342.1 hypothetical protein [Arthrobacter sp. B1I2]